VATFELVNTELALEDAGGPPLPCSDDGDELEHSEPTTSAVVFERAEGPAC
jgi:hypothetical protein